MENPWRVELLGRLCLRRGETAITRFRSPKVGLLLAYLCLFRPQAHAREDLAELLWPDSAPKAARNRLSQLIVWLRPILETEGVMGSILVAERTTVRLDFEAVTTDVNDFETALAVTTAGRIEALRDGLKLYQGDLLPGFYDDWVLTERRRLADARIAALETLSRLYRERGQGGDVAAAATCARLAVAADETREEAHLELMRVLAASGQSASALRQFHEMERVLQKELREKPSGEAFALAERIRGQIAPGPSDTENQENAVSAASGLNFPLPLTRFFGREQEIADAAQMIADGARFITLIGTGGSGKTRLAIEIGRRQVPRFQGAVAFVPLADLADVSLIPYAVAAALGMEAASLSPQRLQENLIQALSARPKLLLIVDNLEHLATGAGRILRTLLEKAPGLFLVVTSRQRLSLHGERELPVLPLPIPSPGEVSLDRLAASPSIRLFVDRAQAVRPSFALTAANAATLTALCRHLEGLPLAIELCAAWSELLTPTQMWEQVEDRFALLVARQEDIPDRHRTLHGALEYSYAQLPSDLKAAFVTLSVFRGGWILEAAAALQQDSPRHILETLSRLRERSLILAEEAGGDTPAREMRYRMLETLREFAADQQTGEQNETLRLRHAEYFLRFAEALGLPDADKAVCLRCFEAEHDNLRAALRYFAEAEQAEAGLRLAQALFPFWQKRGFVAEGAEWMARLFALPTAAALPLRGRARAMNTHTELLTSLADYSGALQVAEAALALWQEADEPKEIGFSLHLMAWPLSRLGETDRAHAAYTKRLEIAHALGDKAGAASSLTNRAQIYFGEKQWDRARDELRKSLAIHRDVGSPRNIAVTLNSLGLVARHQEEYELAEEYFDESLTLMRGLGDTVGEAIALVNLATIHRLNGEYETADRHLQDALRIAAATAERYVTAWCLKERGHLACARKEYREGIYLLGVADALRDALGTTFKPADPEELEQDKQAAREALGNRILRETWESGQRADVARTVAALQTRQNGEFFEELSAGRPD